jgi:deoxyribonuclease-4
LVNNLYICHVIKALGVVVHSGKYTNNNISDSTNYMYRALKYLIKIIVKNKWDIKIFFELGSGEGKDIILTNNTLSEFIDFYNKFSSKYKKYLKLCIDTCHIFAAGYDIRKKGNVNKLLNEIKNDIGIENLGLIHFNDSFYDINTLKDRHSNIGEGYIGKDSLMYLIKKFKRYNIPIILETKDDYKTMMKEILHF